MHESFPRFQCLIVNNYPNHNTSKEILSQNSYSINSCSASHQVSLYGHSVFEYLPIYDPTFKVLKGSMYSTNVLTLGCFLVFWAKLKNYSVYAHTMNLFPVLKAVCKSTKLLFVIITKENYRL